MATLIEQQINRHIYKVNISKIIKYVCVGNTRGFSANQIARFLSRYLINAFFKLISEAINWSVVVNDKQDDAEVALGDAFKHIFPTFA
jgi:hypothetical protein